jgi:hypothetical protein
VLAIPLTVGDRLIGVIAAEDRDPMHFSEWHEAYLEIIANQIALSLDRMLSRPDEGAEPAVGRAVAEPVGNGMWQRIDGTARCRHRVTYYCNDDAIFVDDEYLIRNIPARILRRC